MKTWVMFRVTAGDNNAARRKDLSERFRENPTQENGKALANVMLTDPLHDFYVVAPDDGMMAKALAVAWEKLGAKTSDDLPKPFNMERVSNEVLVVRK